MEYEWLKETCPTVYNAFKEEESDRKLKLQLIASENNISPAVREALLAPTHPGYAEGYPGKRWYGGTRNVDTIEQFAIDTAKELFGASHANVQPHSGADANLAAYRALIKPGESVLALSLDHGGHLTHGMSRNISAERHEFIHYSVREDGTINMDEVQQLAEEHLPRLIVAGYSANSQHIDFEAFSEIAKEVGAYFMVDMAHVAGLVAAGVFPSPVPHADVVTTTTQKTLRGPHGGLILCTEELAKKVDLSVFPGLQGGPLNHNIAAKAVALHEATTEQFKRYSAQVVENAAFLYDKLQETGVRIFGSKTQNHQMTLLVGEGQGQLVQESLENAGIITNKNAIPGDTSPMRPSGIRIGTPTITTRGMDQTYLLPVVNWVASIVHEPQDLVLQKRVEQEVREFCESFPLFAPEYHVKT